MFKFYLFLLETPRAKLCRGRCPLASCGQEQRGWKHWDTHVHIHLFEGQSTDTLPTVSVVSEP